MKKLLLGSIVLTLFSLSVLIFQISCQKEVQAQTGSTYTLSPATTTSLGGVIVGNGLSVTSNGVLSVTSSASGGLTQLNKIIYMRYHDGGNNEREIWTVNSDGSSPTKVPIVLPAGLELDSEGGARLTPDGKKIIFTAYSVSASESFIYTCNVDGSGVTKIVDNSSPDWGYIIGSAY